LKEGTSGCYLRPVLGHQLIIISDAHLGDGPPETEDALLSFLDAVPSLGDCLLINGDLFDFWFAWRRVIPRSGLQVLSALARLRRRVPVVMTGGNHDRWGAEFWKTDLDVDFHPLTAEFQVGGRRVLAVHGDGITETHWSARLLHRVTRNPAAIAMFRALHPDVGFWLVDRLTHRLGNTVRDPAVLDRAAERQRLWAEARLREDPGLGVIVMGHTHRATATEPAPGRHYLNPGAWFEGFRYGVATGATVELRSFIPASPRLPSRAAPP
jgi:UDP-2,3-diacylglucosamine hydrolase